MRSVKPGRGPSAMGAAGSVVSIIFGIFWTISVAGMGAPGVMVFFGLIFILIGVINFVFNFKNTTGSNRMSLYDITDDGEESDPLNELFQANRYADSSKVKDVSSRENDLIYEADSRYEETSDRVYRFCPYCGEKLEKGYQFCPSCGKELK